MKTCNQCNGGKIVWRQALGWIKCPECKGTGCCCGACC